MEYKVINSTDELYHHGIKGQRWGIRRFQNKDGSLTKAGEKRRAKLEGKLEKLGGKKTSGDDAVAQTPKKKTASEMSDDELDKAIVRARKEDEYNRLRPEPVVRSKRDTLINDVIKPAMVNAGRNAIQNAVSKLGDKLISKAFGDKVDPESVEALRKTFDKLDLKNKIDKLQNPEKYLSEEDKNKRQQREFEAENREAQREGYQSVQDRAAKQKAAAEKASADAKAADEAARSKRLEAQRSAMDRAANDVVSNTFINKTTEQPKPRHSSDVPKNVLNDQYVLDAGRSYFNQSASSSVGQTSVNRLSSSTVSSGEEYAARYGNVRWDGDLSKWDDE